RDDVASFLPTYLKKQVLDVDPFKSIDEEGVGFLIRNAVEQGRAVNPKINVGICGEHGGDPRTIDFCFRAGLSYVSCSPYRVPLARLAAAQAVINNMADKPAKTIKSAKADKTVKTAKADKLTKTAKADKAAKPAKATKAAKAGKPAKTAKADKPAKADRSAKTTKAAKPAKADKPRKTDKAAKTAKTSWAAKKAPRADKPAKAADKSARGKTPLDKKTLKPAAASKEPAKRGRKPKK
ncbi:MAG: hypothetical protein LBT93_06075, partial [Treponema sp.]|nr:hypothetical protein [Treponema sp.]